MCLSPYVETFNSKVIKRFRTRTKKSLCVFEFRDSYVLCIYVTNIRCPFWTWPYLAMVQNDSIKKYTPQKDSIKKYAPQNNSIKIYTPQKDSLKQYTLQKAKVCLLSQKISEEGRMEYRPKRCDCDNTQHKYNLSGNPVLINCFWNLDKNKKFNFSWKKHKFITYSFIYLSISKSISNYGQKKILKGKI